MTDELRAYDVVIRGLVQGVGFRFFAREAALRFGVVGTVRNRPDGSVEAHIEGDQAALDRVVEALRRGPFGARVDQLRLTAAAVLGNEERLRVVY